MTKFARLFVISLIAVFAAWSVVQTAGATTMALEMAVVPHGEAHGDGCASDKLGDTCAVLCLGLCNSYVVADAGQASLTRRTSLASHTPVPVQLPAGRAYPPTPRPPRLILI